MNRKLLLRAIVLVLAAAALVYFYYERDVAPATEATVAASAGSDGAIREAYQQQRSGVMVESTGVVEQILRDDLEGSRHQRFILRLRSDHTLLMSHNIDIAPRVPLAEGDLVEFRGQYEWNERGGVVHWTHHDPDGDHPAGWIRHRGERYD